MSRETEEIDPLQGAIDGHYHCMMTQGYRWDLVETARECQKLGMTAVVLKNRYGLSSEMAFLANRLLGQRFYRGTLVLNGWTGGLNAESLRDLCSYGEGICVVEMPTFHAVNEMRWRGISEEKAIKIFSGRDLTDPAKRVLEEIGALGLLLKTGHLSVEESLWLIEKARNFGIQKIVVTHATSPPVMASEQEQKDMSAAGAFIEHCIAPLMPLMPLKWGKRYPAVSSDKVLVHSEYLFSSIRAAGPDRCLVATDLGQDFNPSCAPGMEMFVRLLWEGGFTGEGIRKMTVENPARLYIEPEVKK